MDYQGRIVIDPAMREDQILADFPQLAREDIRACRLSPPSASVAWSRHFSSDEVGGDKDEVSEGAGPEQSAVASSNADRFGAQEAEDAVELINGRLLFDPHQSVGQGNQQSVGGIPVDVSVGTGQVAECLLDSERACLEEKPLMGGAPASSGNGEPDLERHVEARRTTESCTRLRS